MIRKAFWNCTHFAIDMTQSSEELKFTQFKTKLQSYEETAQQKFNSKPESHNVMKVDISSVICYTDVETTAILPEIVTKEE